MTKVVKDAPIVWPDRCPDCNMPYPKDSYEDDETLYKVFQTAALYNGVGSPGTGKSYTVNAMIWRLLHIRLCEYWGVVNFRYSRYVSIHEQTTIIEGHKSVTRVAETKSIPVTEIHPRLVEISNVVEMVHSIATINKSARERKVQVRIMVALDEAPLSSATGAKGATVQMTATSLGMNQLVTISRKMNFGLILISLDESLLQRKMRSQIQGEEGTIKGLVRCVLSKDPQTIRDVSKGRIPAADKISEVEHYRIDDVEFQKLVAFLPQIPGWAPSLRTVGKTPLSCSVDEAEPGDTTFETLTIGGLEIGKIGGITFDAQHFINRLTNVPPEDVPDACLKYLEEDADLAKDEITKLLEETQNGDDEPDEPKRQAEPQTSEAPDKTDELKPRERKTLARITPVFERYAKDEKISFTEVCKLAEISRKTARKFQKLGFLLKIITQPEGDDE